MQDYEHEFTAFLKRKGQKLTFPRKVILNAAFSLHEHFNAERLYRLVREESNKVSLATVYRTIPLLIEAGLLQQSMRSSSRDTYEHILGHPKHIHWVCNNCGTVIETDLDDVLPVLDSYAKRLKFRFDDCKLNVSGLCWKCSESENQNQ